MHIVRFKGGLGNQMFQYAFLKSLEKKGYDVGASLGFYNDFPTTRRFELDAVFPKISMDANPIYDNIFKEKLLEWKEYAGRAAVGLGENISFWNETEEQEGTFQNAVYTQRECVYSGYWQSYRYFELISDTIRNDFIFNENEELITFCKEVLGKNDNTVAVHVRRGDYLNTEQMYGGICTNDYYRTAKECISRKIKNATYVFFSDDIEWVKKQDWAREGIFISMEAFQEYQDWYDMYIMSMCKHNIIANSTFSWWGAWLNRNVNKIVVAPQKWNNLRNYKDIYPNGWICI